MDIESKTAMLEALGKARELENEGYEFYMKAAKNTGNSKGRDMFQFLAKEEVHHYQIVNNLIEKFSGQAMDMPGLVKAESGVFQEADGGKIWEQSDDLDALNIGIQAEKKSIELYSQIHDGSSDIKVQIAMKELVDEEKKHLSILEKEVEFVTETGEYHDFTTVGA